MNQGRNRQQIVESLLRRIVKRPDFPAFAEHISQVMEVVDDTEVSMRHITNVILRDFNLTMKVLRTANSPHYNRTGRSLLSVTHSVALLGLEAIRDLAGGMLMFQHFWKKSAGLKELMLLSVLTAQHARVTAARVKYPHLEEAYLCGMFRNMGEVLVAGYLPRKYAAILSRVKELSVAERAACLKVLGCSYEELGRAAARYWRMPDRVRHCMQAEQSRITRTINTELDVLRAIVSFSHGLTDTVHRRDSAAAQTRLNYLLMTVGPILAVDRREMQAIAEEAIAETKSTFELLQIPLDDLRLRKQTEVAMAALDGEDNEIDGEEAPVNLRPGEELLERLVEEVELALCSESAADINRIVLMILEAVYRGAPFDRVVFALVSPESGLIRGRMGFGEDINTFLDGFRFPLSIRSGPVAVAIMSKQDMLVNDSRFTNTRFGRYVGTTNFGLMPVVVGGVALGCIYFDRESTARPPEKEILYLVSKLRSLAAEAIQVSREGR